MLTNVVTNEPYCKVLPRHPIGNSLATATFRKPSLPKRKG